MDIRVLGPVEIVDEGGSVPLGGAKQRAVLAVLLAASGERVSIERLIDAIYGDDAPEKARRSIHTFVSSLRHSLGDYLHSDRRGYSLDVPDNLVDARRFESVYRMGVSILDDDPDAAAQALRGALSEWGGYAYSDIEAGETIGWEVARLDELRLAAVEARIEADLALGLHRELVGELAVLIAEYPFRERLRAQHMLSLYRAGRQAESLRAFSSARALLVEELGVEPSEELRDLELKILNHDAELTIVLRPSIEALAIVACETTVADLSMPEREREMRDLYNLFEAVAIERGGRVLDVRGATLYGVFPSVERGASAAGDLFDGRGRIAIDYGEVDVSDARVSGPPVTRAAHLSAVAHPGQVLLTADAHAALSASPDEGWIVKNLGRHRLAGTPEAASVFQLVLPSDPSDFGPLQLTRRPTTPGPDRAPFSGYELRSCLVNDDLGKVHIAYQPSLGREVRVRILPAEVVDDPAFIRRFEAEMYRVADFHHPVVVPILDFWREPESAVVVYQPVDGGTAFDPTSTEHGGLDTVMTVAEAMAEAHDRGLVHGHLHPRSILMDNRGQPQLVDMALSSILAGLIPTGVSAYSAPEAIGAVPTPAADVYALGVLAAEVLSGSRWNRDGAPPENESPLGEVISRCLDANPDRRPATAGAFVVAFTEAKSGVGALPRKVRNPYKGLAAFGEADTDDYFGRHRLVERLAQEIGQHRLTAIIGPSGVGKSSAIRAGIFPLLRRGRIQGLPSPLVAHMIPGAEPFESLARALGRVAIVIPDPLVRSLADEASQLGEVVASVVPPGTELVLVIDQFEELYTLASPADLRSFLTMLERELGTNEGPVRVVLTIRADFLDRPLAHPTFGELLAERTVAVHGPSRAELAEIIVRPAEAVGVAVELALVEAICDDASTQPGALPLVEHALTELFDQRRSDTLTLEAFQASGRLAGAVGRSAEEVFQGLEQADRETARSVMVSLVAVGEDSADTRRRVRLPQLTGSGLSRNTVDRVIEAFVARRLIVSDRDPKTHQPTAEVAHEALIREWDRLRQWIDEARDELLVARRIEAAARDWLAADQDPSFLVSGARLEQAEEWQSLRSFGDEETEFVAHSRLAANAAAASRRRTRRRLTSVLAVALAVTVGLAAMANNARTAAEQRATENRVQELIAQAQLSVGNKPDLAILLAIEAYEESKKLGDEVPGEVMLALHQSTQGSRVVTRIPHGNRVVLYHPTTDQLIVDETGSSDLVMYDTNSYEEIGRLDAINRPNDAAFSPDGSFLALTYDGANPGIRLFSGSTYEVVLELNGIGDLAFPQFSADGRYLTAATFSQALVWDLDSPLTEPVVMEGASGGPASFSAFGADGTSIIRASGDTVDPTQITTYDLATGKALASQGLPVRAIRGVTSASGSHEILVATATAAEVWRVGGAIPLRTVPLTGLDHGTFSYAGDLFALHGNNETVVVESLDGSVHLQLENHLGDVWRASFSKDSTRLAALETSGRVTVWDLTATGPSVLANIQTVGIDRLTPFIAADGSTVATIEATGGVSVARKYDTSTGELLAQSSPSVSEVAVSRNGEWAGGTDSEGNGWIERLETAEAVFEAECRTPAAINDEGTYAAFYDTCGILIMELVDLRTGAVVTSRSGNSGIGDSEFGPPDTPAAGLLMFQPEGGSPALIDVATGDVMGTAYFPVGPHWRAKFSADGRFLSLGSANDGGFILSVEAILAGAPPDEFIIINPFIEGGPTRTSMAAGGLGVTTHNETSIRVWSLDTGEEWMNIPTQASSFAEVAMSSDGRLLFYPDHDGVLVRAFLDPEELVEFARSRVTRNFTVQECERYLIAEDCSAYND